ncbi:hypothetical protein GCM10007389_37530 [Pontibacter akesuensis]|nr:hypothetical protein GCM10007389_37530 [Pontibacter akesuensis]
MLHLYMLKPVTTSLAQTVIPNYEERFLCPVLHKVTFDSYENIFLEYIGNVGAVFTFVVYYVTNTLAK